MSKVLSNEEAEIVYRKVTKERRLVDWWNREPLVYVPSDSEVAYVEKGDHKTFDSYGYPLGAVFMIFKVGDTFVKFSDVVSSYSQYWDEYLDLEGGDLLSVEGITTEIVSKQEKHITTWEWV